MFSLDFGSIFSGGWQRFVNNIGSALLYAVVFIVGNFVLSIPFVIVLGPAFLTMIIGARRGASEQQLAAMLGGSLILLVIISIIVGIVSIGWTAGFVQVLKKLTLGEKPEFSDMFSQFGKLLQLVIFYILFAIAVGIGLILFIIPGIFLMIAWSQAFYLIIDKNMDAISAMKTSWERVLKDFWLVTGVLIVWYIIFLVLMWFFMFLNIIIPLIPMLIAYLFVMPFMLMILWALYFALFPRAEAQPTA